MSSNPLVSPALMESLVEIDERAMPSTCTIYFREIVEDDRGGSEEGPWQIRPAVKGGICRIQYANTAREEGVRGGQMTSISDVQIALPLGSVVDSDDQIVATSPLPNGLTITERYEVLGDPGAGSYNTNLPVAVQKVS
jgi:hypothetical protein